MEWGFCDGFELFFIGEWPELLYWRGNTFIAGFAVVYTEGRSVE